MSTRSERMETGRVEAFSDGVFAIAITLLGFALKLPTSSGQSLAASLVAGWPSYVAFFTSFATITIIWINHHRLFTHIARVDHTLLLLNATLLMAVTVVPFGTTILADHLALPDSRRTAAIVYCSVFFAVTGAFNLVWHHAASGRKLLDDQVDRRTIRRINIQYGFGPLLYVASAGIALLSAWASIGANLAFAAFFALPMLDWNQASDARRDAGAAGGQPSPPNRD